MRVQLTDGKTASVSIKHGTTKFKGEERRQTTVMVHLPDGSTITGEAVCDNRDQFSKLEGRRRAFKKVLQADNTLAVNVVTEAYATSGKEGSVEAGSLREAARSHYKISRPDRTRILKVVCPEFFRNSPERKEIRERAVLANLTKKYGSNVMQKAEVNEGRRSKILRAVRERKAVETKEAASLTK